jgi:hypothetical protein
MGFIFIMSLVLPFIYFSLAITWWVAAALITFSYALATPDYVVDKNWDKDFMSAPFLILGGMFNIFRAGSIEAGHQMNFVKKSIKRIKLLR